MPSALLDSKVKHFQCFGLKKNNSIIPILIIHLVHMDSSCLRKEKNSFCVLKDFLHIFEGVIFEYA